MPSGIVEPSYRLKKDDARKMLALELGLAAETKFIGFVGRISKDKGIATILEAFAKIKPELSGYHVALVGKGSDDDINYFKNMAEELKIDNRIHFSGFKDNVWPYYRAFDCKILPSIVEGVSQALLEAMACECPVIGSRTGGIVDIIDHEKTGLLFDTLDSSDLADKILQTLQYEDATKKCIETARENVGKHHTIDAMGRNIIRIYRLHQVKLDRRSF